MIGDDAESALSIHESRFQCCGLTCATCKDGLVMLCANRWTGVVDIGPHLGGRECWTAMSMAMSFASADGTHDYILTEDDGHFREARMHRSKDWNTPRHRARERAMK